MAGTGRRGFKLCPPIHLLLLLGPVGYPRLVLLVTMAIIQARMPQCVTPFQTCTYIPLAKENDIYWAGVKGWARAHLQEEVTTRLHGKGQRDAGNDKELRPPHCHSHLSGMQTHSHPPKSRISRSPSGVDTCPLDLETLAVKRQVRPALPVYRARTTAVTLLLGRVRTEALGSHWSTHF